MKTRNHPITLSLVIFMWALSGGCSREQCYEFRGSITRNGAPIFSGPAVDVGASIGQNSDSRTEALQCYSLSAAKVYLFFTYDLATLLKTHRFTSDIIHAVYYAEQPADYSHMPKAETSFWKNILQRDEAERDKMPGIRRLRGTFIVERHKSNVDFRYRIKMQTDSPDVVKIDGILTCY